MTRPNLFSFATSELSQDAFLCWLAALADHDEADLQRMGRSFIAWLWERTKGTSIVPEQVSLIKAPERQVDHIDVMFEAKVEETPVLFLIEDKTETSHHSGQLKRYLEVVKHGHVIPIYFKTGYHFGADLAAAHAKYTVIDLGEWVRFLKAQTVHNDILDDYRAHVCTMLEKREAALAALTEPTGFHAFNEDFVQYEFMQRLADRCPDFIGRRQTYHDRSVGGQPWTQHVFAEFKDALHGGVSEALFYRIDRRSGRWYLSVRQYGVVKGVPDAQLAKLARLGEYRKLLVRAVQDGAARLNFEKAPAADHRGKNESEIGVLFFDKETNSTTNVLEMLPAVHRAFVASLAGRTSL